MELPIQAVVVVVLEMIMAHHLLAAKAALVS
jgi:hypothetical protein